MCVDGGVVPLRLGDKKAEMGCSGGEMLTVIRQQRAANGRTGGVPSRNASALMALPVA